MTDPETVDFPTKRLLSAAYLDDRRDLIDADSSLPAAVELGVRPDGVSTGPLEPGGDTCYLLVVDSDGLAVSLIQSIYFDFGSGLIAGESDIIPQDRGSFFRSTRTISTASNPASERSTR